MDPPTIKHIVQSTLQSQTSTRATTDMIPEEKTAAPGQDNAAPFVEELTEEEFTQEVNY